MLSLSQSSNPGQSSFQLQKRHCKCSETGHPGQSKSNIERVFSVLSATSGVVDYFLLLRRGYEPWSWVTRITLAKADPLLLFIPLVIGRRKTVVDHVPLDFSKVSEDLSQHSSREMGDNSLDKFRRHIQKGGPQRLCPERCSRQAGTPGQKHVLTHRATLQWCEETNNPYASAAQTALSRQSLSFSRNRNEPIVWNL